MENNVPYQKYIDAGYFEVIEQVTDGTKMVYLKTLITGKGQLYFADKLKTKI